MSVRHKINWHIADIIVVLFKKKISLFKQLIYLSLKRTPMQFDLNMKDNQIIIQTLKLQREYNLFYYM